MQGIIILSIYGNLSYQPWYIFVTIYRYIRQKDTVKWHLFWKGIRNKFFLYLDIRFCDGQLQNFEAAAIDPRLRYVIKMKRRKEVGCVSLASSGVEIVLHVTSERKCDVSLTSRIAGIVDEVKVSLSSPDMRFRVPSLRSFLGRHLRARCHS